MFLKTWRLMTLILVALFMGLEFAHTLELPAKMQYDATLYVTIQNSPYQYFGAPGLGAVVTVGAVLAARCFADTRKGSRSQFSSKNADLRFGGHWQVQFVWRARFTCARGIAFPLIYFLRIEPVNVVMEQATARSVPTDWTRLRDQWEYAHASNFVFGLAGFIALVMSVLVDVPQLEKGGS
ncbi:hypothetical protein [Phormidesmis priestleyi]